MAFYKLFQIVHFRTDWYQLYRWERESIMPQWYEEKRKQAEIHLRALTLATLGIQSKLGTSEYFLEYKER